jgi:hypothetical protein
MSVVTYEIVEAKPPWIHNFILKQFKIATLTLEMYCGLHFQLIRAHYHS